MNSDDVISQAEVLTFDIPDDVLEQTASAEHTAFTLVYCTNTATCPTVRPITSCTLICVAAPLAPSILLARAHPEYGFALALICVALALVFASVMFPDAFRPSAVFALVGP
jgi:hypothetical protein